MINKFKELNLAFKILIITIITLLILYIFFFFSNCFINVGLRQYIRTYSPCSYSDDRITPKYYKDGDYRYYTFVTDNNIKVVELTDLHIGGGFLSYKRDRKTIKETITIIQNELPDLVILNGDFLYPGITSSGTINNRQTLKTIMYMMNHLGTYYTFNLGKTDIHTFSYLHAKGFYNILANSKSKYLLYQPYITNYGYTNQFFVEKNSKGLVSNIIFTIDSNEKKINNKEFSFRKNNGIIFDEQVSWAKEIINYFTLKNQTIIDESIIEYTDDERNNYLPVKSFVYTHIPVSEYAIAYEDLIHRNFAKTLTSEYVSGIWDELVMNNDYKTQIHYNGRNTGIEIGKEDKLLEVLSTELKSLKAVFFGGDHLNNGIINYKGVYLCSNYSLDNITIKDIKNYGAHRGLTVVTYNDYGSSIITPLNIYEQSYIVENGKLNNGNKKGPYNSFFLPNK